MVVGRRAVESRVSSHHLNRVLDLDPKGLNPNPNLGRNWSWLRLILMRMTFRLDCCPLVSTMIQSAIFFFPFVQYILYVWMAISSSLFTRCLFIICFFFFFYFSSSPQALPFSFSPHSLSFLSSFQISCTRTALPLILLVSFFFLIGMYARKTFFYLRCVLSCHGCGGVWVGLSL